MAVTVADVSSGTGIDSDQSRAYAAGGLVRRDASEADNRRDHRIRARVASSRGVEGGQPPGGRLARLGEACRRCSSPAAKARQTFHGGERLLTFRYGNSSATACDSCRGSRTATGRSAGTRRRDPAGDCPRVVHHRDQRVLRSAGGRARVSRAGKRRDRRRGGFAARRASAAGCTKRVASDAVVDQTELERYRGGAIMVAVLVGGAVGPPLLAPVRDSAAASWGLGAAMAVGVAACLFGAYACYRRRVLRTWQR